MDNDCKQNPMSNPLTPNDPRNWAGVTTTVVTPAWFSDYVLSVGAVDAAGNPRPDFSLAGPWVGIAAPGTDVVSLSPRGAGLISAEEPRASLVAPVGTSFSAAIVSGVAALVRAKFPSLTAHQIINRLIATARPPAGEVDNVVGHGIVDPVAALSYDLPAGEPLPPQNRSSPLVLPPPPPRDMTPVWWGWSGVGAIAVLAAATVGLSALLRQRRR